MRHDDIRDFKDFSQRERPPPPPGLASSGPESEAGLGWTLCHHPDKGHRLMGNFLA